MLGQLLLLLVTPLVPDDVVVFDIFPDAAAVVVVVGPLEAVLVMEAEEAVIKGPLLLLQLLVLNPPNAGGVEIGIGDAIAGGGVRSGTDAIRADTFGVFGVLTGGGGIGPFEVRLGDGEGMGTLLPEEFIKSAALVGVDGIWPKVLCCCCCC